MNGAAGPSLIPGAIKRILQSAKIGLWLFFYVSLQSRVESVQIWVTYTIYLCLSQGFVHVFAFIST